MKFIGFLLFIPYFIFAQEPDQDIKFEIFNCQPVKGNFLWASETEVTNFQYWEFLQDTRKKTNDSVYESLLPDTTVWRAKNSYNEPYVEYYLRHPAYRDYPVVGISHAQAIAFCVWLTKSLNSTYSKDQKHPIQELVVRLPNEEEWVHAAKGGDPYAIFPWPGYSIRHTDKKYQGSIRANFVRGKSDYMGVAGHLNDNADVTAPVFSYWPNDYGLYNMSGNVAEMLNEDGRTKGGSWASRAKYIEINGPDEFIGFQGGSCKIGFRYFVEILDFKDLKKSSTDKITAKNIDQLLIPVANDSSTYFISKYEVSNELYRQFLNSRPDSSNFPNSRNWKTAAEYPDIFINDYATHSSFANHPVVNISKEAAQNFCSWIESIYDNDPKRKGAALSFRLPTEQEWEKAASGGLEWTPYPWGGPYVRNSKGCLLCNYNPVQERWILDQDSLFIRSDVEPNAIRKAGALDGHLYTCPIDSYYPNNIGLYNMSGNVAEMLSDQEYVKGGSWGSFRQYINIRAREQRATPSPYVGFRFVAEKK